MSKKPKPNFQGPPTQEQSLKDWKPQGFYSPVGNMSWGDEGYNVNLDQQYDPLQVLPEYQAIRQRLLGDLGVTSAERASQLDQYGQAFMDKSLEYSAPRLQAMTYGRGQAGSRMAGDAYADLINKASTDSVLSREQLRSIDEQLKMQQLQQMEGGIGNAYNQYSQMISQMLAGGQISEQAAQSAINQARQYVQDQNTLESERYQRALQSHQEQANRWQAGVAIAAAPFTGGASLAMMPSGSVGGGFNLGGMSQMAGMGGMSNMPSFSQSQPGWAVPGLGGYGAGTPMGAYNTGSMTMLPKRGI